MQAIFSMGERPPSLKMRQLFIVWNIFQRRAVSMQAHFDFGLKFFPAAFKPNMLRPLDYIIRGLCTIRYLRRKQPNLLWIQLPPVPLLYVAFLFKFVRKGEMEIIADCHNSMIQQRWLRWPFCKKLLRRCRCILVHNAGIKEKAEKMKIQDRNLFVLEDPPATLDCSGPKSKCAFPEPWILFPSSFSRDEPIAEIFRAAPMIPEITLVLTGDYSRIVDSKLLKRIPSNINLTGFLRSDEFEKLLCETEIVMGLTKWEGVQLSVCNEAVGLEKPLILADTEILKTLFYKGTVFVDAKSHQSIAAGCHRAIKNIKSLKREMIQLKRERMRYWNEQAQNISGLSRMLN